MVDDELSRSEALLIRSNQRFDEWLQSFTQYAYKNLICDREKACTLAVDAYRRVPLFQDRIE